MSFVSKVASTAKSNRSKTAASKQVKLKLVHIDFWSAIKVGFTVTVGLGVATIAGFIFLFLVLSASGLFNSLNGLLTSVFGAGIDLSLPRVISFAVGLAIFNCLVGTILSGVGALVFNLIGRITGGLSIGFTNN
jgi:hypothetical protein